MVKDINILNLIASNSIALIIHNQINIVSDSEKEKREKIFKEYFRILRENGKLCLITSAGPDKDKNIYMNDASDSEQIILMETNLYRYCLHILNRTYLQTSDHHQNTIEFLNVFVKDGKPNKVTNDIKSASIIEKKEWITFIPSIWNIGMEDKNYNHNAYPYLIPYRLIKMYSFKDDYILDISDSSLITKEVSTYLQRKFFE